jgi:hypothetical protein
MTPIIVGVLIVGMILAGLALAIKTRKGDPEPVEEKDLDFSPYNLDVAPYSRRALPPAQRTFKKSGLEHLIISQRKPAEQLEEVIEEADLVDQVALETTELVSDESFITVTDLTEAEAAEAMANATPIEDVVNPQTLEIDPEYAGKLKTLDELNAEADAELNAAFGPSLFATLFNLPQPFSQFARNDDVDTRSSEYVSQPYTQLPIETPSRVEAPVNVYLQDDYPARLEQSYTTPSAPAEPAYVGSCSPSEPSSYDSGSSYSSDTSSSACSDPW